MSFAFMSYLFSINALTDKVQCHTVRTVTGMSNTLTKFQSLEDLSIRDLLSDCLSRNSFLIFL